MQTISPIVIGNLTHAHKFTKAQIEDLRSALCDSLSSYAGSHLTAGEIPDWQEEKLTEEELQDYIVEHIAATQWAATWIKFLYDLGFKNPDGSDREIGWVMPESIDIPLDYPMVFYLDAHTLNRPNTDWWDKIMSSPDWKYEQGDWVADPKWLQW